MIKKDSQLLNKVDCYFEEINNSEINNLSRIKKLNDVKALLNAADIKFFTRAKYLGKYRTTRKNLLKSVSFPESQKIR